MAGGLPGQQRWMDPAQDDLDAPAAIIVGPAIAAGRGAGDAGDADDVHLQVQRDRTGCLIVDGHFGRQLFDRDGREQGQGDRRIMEILVEHPIVAMHGAGRSQEGNFHLDHSLVIRSG